MRWSREQEKPDYEKMRGKNIVVGYFLIFKPYGKKQISFNLSFNLKVHKRENFKMRWSSEQEKLDNEKMRWSSEQEKLD